MTRIWREPPGEWLVDAAPLRPGEAEKFERWIIILMTAGDHACAELLRRELEERKARELRH
jgi:hypothetical protein